MLKHFKTREKLDLKNIGDLKHLLKHSNPTMLKDYIHQLSILRPHLKVEGMGTSLKIYDTRPKAPQ
jgi:hypothetical protein